MSGSRVVQGPGCRVFDPVALNTDLHHALIAGNTSEALRLAEALPTRLINKQALGNTPLMLALKTGQFDVAKVLLQRHDVEWHIPDNRQVFPIHYLCALRCNTLIRLFLKRVHAEHSSGGGASEALSLEDLKGILTSYQLDPNQWPGVGMLYSGKHRQALGIANRTLLKMYSDDFKLPRIKFEMAKYSCAIVERDRNLVLDSAPELTDLFCFHIRLVCVNQDLVNADAFDAVSHPQMATRFYKEFEVGVKAFVSFRNRQELADDILSFLDPAKEVVALKGDVPDSRPGPKG